MRTRSIVAGVGLVCGTGLLAVWWWQFRPVPIETGERCVCRECGCVIAEDTREVRIPVGEAGTVDVKTVEGLCEDCAATPVLVECGIRYVCPECGETWRSDVCDRPVPRAEAADWGVTTDTSELCDRCRVGRADDRGRALYREGRYAEALEHFELAAALGHQRSEVWGDACRDRMTEAQARLAADRAAEEARKRQEWLDSLAVNRSPGATSRARSAQPRGSTGRGSPARRAPATPPRGRGATTGPIVNCREMSGCSYNSRGAMIGAATLRIGSNLGQGATGWRSAGGPWVCPRCGFRLGRYDYGGSASPVPACPTDGTPMRR